MPNKACKCCVDELLRSWNFVEKIREAEKQLDKLLSEQMQDTFNQNDNQQTMEFKTEQCIEQTNHAIDNKLDARMDDDYFNDCGGGYDENDSSIDDHGEVFGESIDYVKDECSESETKNTKPQKESSKKKQPNTNNLKNDPFFATLNPEDFLENGQLSSAAVTKLTKLNPDMTTMSWSECQYKCTKCKQILKGATHLFSHMRSMHIDDPKMSVKLSCFYCDFKHAREATINRHISTEHFEHLQFR